ncbi:hypothetical protein M8J77_024328 [Diaphorina citri]|nr:hypothetical protein M8J77_024328 [Diaphorina citri]
MEPNGLVCGGLYITLMGSPCNAFTRAFAGRKNELAGRMRPADRGLDKPVLHTMKLTIKSHIGTTPLWMILNHYRHRIDPKIDDKCPKCGGGPHDTIHLFNDLWLVAESN